MARVRKLHFEQLLDTMVKTITEDWKEVANIVDIQERLVDWSDTTEGNKQKRATFIISKKQGTWDNIKGIINKTKAPFYKWI